MVNRESGGVWVPFAWISTFPAQDRERGSERFLALMILADIDFLHKPKPNGRPRFNADLLQKSYQDYADLFGVSKKRVTCAFDYLEELGVIRRVWRNLGVKNRGLSNVLFIDYRQHRLEQVLEGGISPSRGRWSDPQGVDGVPLAGDTYTHAVVHIPHTQRTSACADSHAKENMKPITKGRVRQGSEEVKKLLAEPKELDLKKPGTLNAVTVWKNVLPLHYDVGFVPDPTVKQAAQLKRIVKTAGADGASVIKWAIEHWQKVTDRVRYDTGIANFPKVPDIGFLNKYVATAIELYRKAQSVPVVKAKKPVNISSKPVNSVAEKAQEEIGESDELTAEYFLKITGYKPGGGSK